MEFPEKKDNVSEQEEVPVKRGRGRPAGKMTFIPDSARGTIQLVPSQFVKKNAEGVPTKIMTVAESNALTTPKKPLSEAQKANLQKLLAANQARRDHNKAQQLAIPEDVPEGYEAVYVKPSKAVYSKDQLKQRAEDAARPPPPPPEWMELMRQMNDRMSAFTQYQQNQVQAKPKEKPRPPKKPSKGEYKKRNETSDSEAPTDSESGFDTSDTEYVKKYEKKAAKRMEAVKAIEEKLQKKPVPPPAPAKPKNKYDSLSIF
jgi:hypothetical protein